MPKYVIEGKTVQTDKALSDVEIDEIASSIKGKTRPASPPGMNSWVVSPEVQAERDRKATQLREMNPNDSNEVKQLYKLNPAPAVKQPISQVVDKVTNEATKEQDFKNLVKQGFGEYVGLWGGVRKQSGEAASNFANLTKAIATGDTQELANYGFRDPKVAFRAFIEGYREAEEATYTLTGARRTPEPTSLAGKALEFAVKSIGDPTSLVAPVGKTIGGTVLRMLGSELGSSFVSGSSVFTGEAGKKIEQGIFGTSGTTGQVVGSLAGIGTAGVGQYVANKGVATAVSGTKYLLKADPEMAQMAQTYGVVNNFLGKIAAEQGIENVDSFVKEWSNVSKTITGKNTPILVALSDNPAVQAAFASLLKTDPDYRAAVTSELKDISSSLEARANTILGSRNSPIPSREVAKVDVAETRIKALDKAIDASTARISPNMSDEARGKIISDLVAKKEKAARDSVSPIYNAVIESGMKEGVRLGSAETGKLYNFIKQNNLEDVFGKGTPLGDKILNVLSPRKASQSVTTQSRDASGMLRDVSKQTTVDVFPEIDANNIDSLKRAINEAGRKSLTNDERRKLNDLNSLFNQVRETLPAKFNEGLKSADLEFYKKVGVPFNSATMDAIDAKKFAEQVAPVIATSSSKTREFLNAVGTKQGQPVVRNAVLSEIYSKFVSPETGALNTRGLANYMKQRKDVISQVDGLDKEIGGFVGDFTKLSNARATLQSNYEKAQSEIAKTYLVSKGFEPNYSKWATELLNEPSKMTKLVGDKSLGIKGEFANFPPETKDVVLKNLRREIVQKAFDRTDGMEFFTNPANKATIDKLFGKGYQDKVGQMLKLSDAVRRVDPTRVAATFEQKNLDVVGKYLSDLGLPGLDLPFISATARNPISSPFYKVTRIFSKTSGAILDKEAKAALKEILIDPEGLSKFVEKYKNVKTESFNNPVKVGTMLQEITARFPMYVYQAEKGNINNAASQPKPKADIPAEYTPLQGEYQ